MNIKCIDPTLWPWECNVRLIVITDWLEENVGHRWQDWDWSDDYYGIVAIEDPEVATMFKLKFGV